MNTRTINFTLNGESVTAQIGTHQHLVEVLQARGLNGARESCAQGLCGCCTVLVNDVAVSGCLYLAAFAREPMSHEQAVAEEYLAKPREDAAGKPLPPAEAKRLAYEDLLWALINTKEFLYNH